MPQSLLSDIRYAFRLLRKSPSFSSIAVLTLALGIGANTAIFSLVYGVLLRPLPYTQPDRIVTLEQTYSGGGRNDATDATHYLFWRDHQQSFDALACYRGAAGENLESGDQPERVRSRPVTAGFFRVLRVEPVLGRAFLPDEDQPSAPAVAILGYGLWQRRFGRDARVLGRDILLAGSSYRVVGVAPPGMDSTLDADVWIPLRPETDRLGSGSNFNVLARLKDGISASEAQAQMKVLAEQFRKESPKSMRPTESIGVFSYHDEAVRHVRPSLLILFAAVGAVLLIASANVANLLLVRVAGRRREIAVRLAIGAPRHRLIRQLLTESVCLSLAGSLLGLGLARAAVWAIVTFRPMDLPRLDEITVDSSVLLFTFVIALVTGILFGLAPAIQALGSDIRSTIQEGGSRSGEGRGGKRLRGALVVLECALSVVLLVGATLLVESFVKLRRVDPGFDPSHVLTMQMSMSGVRYRTAEQAASFADRAVAAVRTLPGVASVAMTNYVPLSHGFNIPLSTIEGRPNPEGRFLGNLEWFGVTPEFFNVLRISVRGGRAFDDRDRAGSPPVVIVNEAFVRRHFGRDNPLTQRIVIAWDLIGKDAADLPRQVIGVVSDIREGALENPPRPTVFVPLAQVNNGVAALVNGMMPTALMVRTTGEPMAGSRQVTEAIRAIDPLLPVFAIQPMESVVGDSIHDQRFLMILLGSFAALASILAAIGIYGVMSYAVTQMTREIGIRAALGAAPSALLGMILRQGITLAVAGAVIGVGGAFALTRLLNNFLFGVTARDVTTFIATPVALVAIGALACYVPARRALRIDPVRALRYE